MTKAIGERRRIDAEDPERLAGVVLIDLEIAECESGDQISLRVLHGDRDLDEVHVHDEAW